MTQIDAKVFEAAQLIAERGWKCTICLKAGERISNAYITATDWLNGYIQVERVGERHLKPKVFALVDISELIADWS